MPRMRLNVRTKQKGVIFSKAKTKAAAGRMVTQINEDLAQEAANRIQAHLKTVLQNPTGFYESNIQVMRGSTMRGVWDNNVSYGGWLEGVDSRNRTTRFKGYQTFKKVKQSMDRDKQGLAQPAVDRFVREMNG